MRKYLFLALMLFVNAISFADWIEPYGSGCNNDLYAGNVTSYSMFIATRGIVNVEEVFIDVLAADSDTLKAVNITTTTLASPTSAWVDLGFFTQPVHARTITVQYDKALGAYDADLATHTFSGTVNLYGLDARGNTISESLKCQVNTLNTSSAAFAFVSSMTWSVTSTDSDYGTYSDLSSMRACLGFGVKVGVCNTLALTYMLNGKSGVYKVIENGANINPINASFVVDTTHYTLNFVTDPNGTIDYYVWYRAYSR